MVFKILGILLILFFIYSIFFKKDKANNKHDKMISDDMVECKTCKIYVSINESILSDKNNYCSEECFKNKK